MGKNVTTNVLAHFPHKSWNYRRLEIEENNNAIARVQSYLTSLREAVYELKTNGEQFQVKEKTMEKAFKKDFTDATPVVQEQAAKIYR